MSNTAVGVPVELRGVRAAFDVERIRADFPILRRQVRGRALTYLDNAATTQKPQPMLKTSCISSSGRSRSSTR